MRQYSQKARGCESPKRGAGAVIITRDVRRSTFDVRRSTFDVRRSGFAVRGGYMRRVAILAIVLGLIVPVRAQRPVISTRPDTPFKLATFEAAGKVRVGLVLGTRVIDVESAQTMIIQELAL